MLFSATKSAWQGWLHSVSSLHTPDGRSYFNFNFNLIELKATPTWASFGRHEAYGLFLLRCLLLLLLCLLRLQLL